MMYLYNKEDAFRYLKNNKKLNILNIIHAVVLLIIVILITKLLFSKIIIVIDIILTSAYLIYLDISLFYLRKQNIIKYQFLAKLDNFEHEVLTSCIKAIKKEKLVKNIIALEVELDNARCVFIEAGKIDINSLLDKKIQIELCDNFIIGWCNYEN